jgi:hypothetical protein
MIGSRYPSRASLVKSVQKYSIVSFFSSFFFGLFESVSSEILSLSSFSTISLSRLFRISSIFHDFATIFIFVISLGSKKNSSTRLSIISRKARNQTS